MSDFSKQWCDLNDPEMPHDWDIEQIASTIDPGNYKAYICEGFGFTAIGKDLSGEIVLYFPSSNLEDGDWKDYTNFINTQSQRIL